MTFTSLQQLKSFGSSPRTIWADIPWPIDQSDYNMLRSCNTYDTQGSSQSVKEGCKKTFLWQILFDVF